MHEHIPLRNKCECKLQCVSGAVLGQARGVFDASRQCENRNAGEGLDALANQGLGNQLEGAII